MSERKLESLAAKFIFALAAGSAPARKLASQELITTVSTDYLHIEGNVAGLMMNMLLISVTTLVILLCSQLVWNQQPVMTSTRRKLINLVHESAVRRFADTYVYPHGQRYHTTEMCTAVRSAKSSARHYTKCRVCG
eukprot:2102305-Amphidinium_carterae.1